MSSGGEQRYSPFLYRHAGPEAIDREYASECLDDMQTIPSSIGGAVEVLATWFKMVRDKAEHVAITAGQGEVKP